MNILYLISHAGRGGAEKYVEELMRLCASRGWECRLGYWEEGPLSRKTAAASFPVLRLDLRPSRALSAARTLAACCRDCGVDVIHAQFPRENVIAVLSRLFRPATRVVYTDHLSLEQGAKWRILNKLITPYDDAVVALYAGAASRLERSGADPRRIRVIPNGVETGPLPPRQNVIREEFSLGEDCFVFLTLARFAPEKGLDVLLSAADKLRHNTDRPFVCLIAGEGEGLEPFRQEVSRRGLEGTILCPGYRQDARALLCSADAYVSPSRSEAMSFAILEAMGCGLPLAVTDAGAGEELAEGCGLVSPAGDAHALAENMCQLMTDAQARAAMGRAAHRRVTEKYDLNRQAEAVMALYAGEK